MKHWLLLFALLFSCMVQAQQLQLHYDFRHSIDPERTRRNFPSLTFEYFKSADSTGSFLLKLQADFNGEKSNPGQTFLQVSKNIRHWKPKVYVSLHYSGGLGVVPPAFGYSIANSFGAGIAYPFQYKGAWLSAGLIYRYNAFRKGSHDAQLSFYFWKGFLHYQLQVAGSLVAWTQNRNEGTDFTRALSGKKFALFGDPQIWVKVWRQVSVGTRINLFYHVLTEKNALQVYPTIGIRQQF